MVIGVVAFVASAGTLVAFMAWMEARAAHRRIDRLERSDDHLHDLIIVELKKGVKVKQ